MFNTIEKYIFSIVLNTLRVCYFTEILIKFRSEQIYGTHLRL